MCNVRSKIPPSSHSAPSFVLKRKKKMPSRRMACSMPMSMLRGSLDAGIFLTEKGKVLCMNAAAKKLFGSGGQETHYNGASDTPLQQEAVVSMFFDSFANFKSWDDVINDIGGSSDGAVLSAIGRKVDGSKFPVEVSIFELAGCACSTTTAEDKQANTDSSTSIFCLYVREDNSEQKSIEDSTKQNEEVTMAMIDSSFDAMIQIDQNGIIQMVNEAAVEQFGWTHEEFVGNNISMIVGGGHSDMHDQYIRRYLETGEKRVMGKKRELLARRKDGSEFPVELGLTEVEVESGRKRLFCGFVRDLTRQKEDERALRRRKSLTIGLIESSFDAMLQINEHGIIQLVNEAAVDQFGWTREEFIGKNISIIVGGGHADRHDQYIRRYLETGEKRVMGKRRELLARRKDGTEFPIELGLTEVEISSGDERLFCGFIRDLTQHKQDEEKLRRREDLTTGLIESSFDAMLQINEHGIIQLVNQAAVDQFGWTRGELIGGNISMIVGGGHAGKHDQYLRRYLKTGEKRVIGKRRELLARTKDGSEFPIELGLTEVKIKSGEERLFCGYVRDLTRQKKDEELLRRNQRMTENIIEASFDALLAVDTYGVIQRVNEAAVRQFGWMREEMIGQNISVIVTDYESEDGDNEVKPNFESRIAMDAGKQRELEARRKNGSTFPIMIGVAEIEGPEGAHVFAAFIRDLTEHKRMMEVEIEKTATEVLLLNVLPREIALRLRDDPSHIADHHKSATILFADIVGFTSMSSRMSPVDVVKMLNDLFSRFDEIVDRYDLNKVKTIGDCYMVTSVPVVEHEENECSRVCHFAFDMMDALHAYNLENPDRNLDLRVGIHVGPVVAGVVGTKRFLYDLWGDAVNLASRMESTGVPGKIQVTKEIVDLVGSGFDVEARGVVHVKGKGEMETYFLVNRKRKRPSLLVPQSRRRSVTMRKEESMRGISLIDRLRGLESDFEDSTLFQESMRFLKAFEDQRDE